MGFLQLPDEYANLRIRQSTIKYAGSLGQWDKRLVEQASHVPSMYYSLQKPFQLFFIIILLNYKHENKEL